MALTSEEETRYQELLAMSGGSPMSSLTTEYGTAEEESGFLGNIMTGTGERAGELAGNLLQTGADFNDWMNTYLGEVVVGTEGIDYYSPEDISAGRMEGKKVEILKRGAEIGKELDLGYEADYTVDKLLESEGIWDGVKNTAGLIVEQGLVSAPDMAALIVTAPAYLASRTTELSYERARNNKRDKPTSEDRIWGSATALASLAVDKFGLSKVQAKELSSSFVKSLGKKAGYEAGTEAVQEFGEYAGTTVGTEEGFDIKEAGKAALGGALGGAGIGAVFGAPSALKTSMEELNEVDAADNDAVLQGLDEELGTDAPVAEPEPVVPQPTAPVEDMEEKVLGYPKEDVLTEARMIAEDDQRIVREEQARAKAEAKVTEATVLDKVKETEQELKLDDRADELNEANYAVEDSEDSIRRAQTKVASDPTNLEAKVELGEAKAESRKARIKQRKVVKKQAVAEAKDEAEAVKDEATVFLSANKILVGDSVKVEGDKKTYEMGKPDTTTGKVEVQQLKKTKNEAGDVEYVPVEGTQKTVDITSLKKQEDVVRAAKPKELTKKEEAKVEEQAQVTELMKPTVTAVEAPVEAVAPVKPTTPTATIAEAAEEQYKQEEAATIAKAVEAHKAKIFMPNLVLHTDGVTVLDAEGELKDLSTGQRAKFFKTRGLTDPEALTEEDKGRSPLAKAKAKLRRMEENVNIPQGDIEKQAEVVRNLEVKAEEVAKREAEVAAGEVVKITDVEEVTGVAEGVEAGVEGQAEVDVVEAAIDEEAAPDIEMEEAPTPEDSLAASIKQMIKQEVEAATGVKPKAKPKVVKKKKPTVVEHTAQSLDQALEDGDVNYDTALQMAQTATGISQEEANIWLEDNAEVAEVTGPVDYVGKPVTLHRGLKEDGTPRGYAGTFYSEDVDVAKGYAKTSISEGTVEEITFTPKKVFDVDAVQNWNEEGKLAMLRKLMDFMKDRGVNIEDSYVYDVLEGETDFAFPIAADAEFLAEQGYDSVRYEREGGVTQKSWFVLNEEEDMAMATALPTEYDVDYYNALKGVGTATDAVDVILTNTKNPVVKSILERIKPLLRSSTSFNLILKDDMSPRMRKRFAKSEGSYSYENDMVKLYPNMESEVNEEALVHELLHSVTHEAIMQDRGLIKELGAIQDSIKDYYADKTDLDIWDKHILKAITTNKRELITYAFTNPEVQVKLQKIPHKRSGMDIFNAFVNLIMKAFNLNVDSKSALAGIIMQGEKAFQKAETIQKIEQDIATEGEGIVEIDEDYQPTEEEMAMFDFVETPVSEDPELVADYHKEPATNYMNQYDSIRKGADAMRTIYDKMRTKGLAFIPNRPLLDMLDRMLPEGIKVGRVQDFYDRAEAKADVRIEAIDANLIKPLQRYKRDNFVEYKLMVQMALRGSQLGKDITGTEAFKSLDDTGQQLYKDLLAHYQAMAVDKIDSLTAYTESLDIDPSHKEEMMEVIKDLKGQINNNKAYFPFNRFGNFKVDGTLPSGERYVSHHDTLQDANRARARREAEGGQFIVGKVDSYGNAASDLLTPEAYNRAKKFVEDSGGNEMAQEALWQTFLEYSPQSALRRRVARRKSVMGMSADMVRGLGQSVHRDIRFNERLKVKGEVDKVFSEVNAHISDMTTDKVEIEELYAELRKREVVDVRAAWSKNITKMNFGYYLGFNPASALVNLTQNAVVAMPVLSADYNPAKVFTTMNREFFHVAKNIRKTDKNLGYKGIYAEAMTRMMEDGTVNVTQAHMMTGINEGHTADFNPDGIGGTFTNAMAFMFHNAEIANRATTAMSAFKLNYEQTKDFDEALAYAKAKTYESQFDFSETGKSRAQRSNWGNVLLAMKSYPISMAVYMTQNFNRWVLDSKATPAEKKAAKIKFLGTMITTTTIGGATALPLSVLIPEVFTMLFGDDEDEPQAIIREAVYSVAGETLGDVMLDGLVGTVTGLDLTSKVSLGLDMFARVQGGQSAKKNMDAVITGALGPVGGMVTNAVRGWDQINEGRMAQGVTTMLPAALRNLIKGGIQMETGRELTGRDTLIQEAEAKDALLKALGFNSEEHAEYFREFQKEMRAENAKRKARRVLLHAKSWAVVQGDSDARHEAKSAIREYNMGRPRIEWISPSDEKRALRDLRKKLLGDSS